MRLRVKLLRSISTLLVILSALLLVMSSGARTHKHWGQGFSVDLNSPYDQVIKIVRQVTQDGVIRGTWQYRGTKETRRDISRFSELERSRDGAVQSAAGYAGARALFRKRGPGHGGGPLHR